MKISNKQLIILFDMVKATCYTAESFGGYTRIARIKIINDIISQQSTNLIELKDEDNK